MRSGKKMQVVKRRKSRVRGAVHRQAGVPDVFILYANTSSLFLWGEYSATRTELLACAIQTARILVILEV